MARGPSEAARVFAYQTRARMGATLWFRVAAGILLAWVGVTLGAVWYETGEYFPQLQHLHFWQWVLCNVALDVPVLRVAAAHLSLPIDGAWYRIPALADWLNGDQFITCQSAPGSGITRRTRRFSPSRSVPWC